MSTTPVLAWTRWWQSSWQWSVGISNVVSKRRGKVLVVVVLVHVHVPKQPLIPKLIPCFMPMLMPAVLSCLDGETDMSWTFGSKRMVFIVVCVWFSITSESSISQCWLTPTMVVVERRTFFSEHGALLLLKVMFSTELGERTAEVQTTRAVTSRRESCIWFGLMLYACVVVGQSWW